MLREMQIELAYIINHFENLVADQIWKICWLDHCKLSNWFKAQLKKNWQSFWMHNAFL